MLMADPPPWLNYQDGWFAFLVVAAIQEMLRFAENHVVL
jgi:hypothetical protein